MIMKLAFLIFWIGISYLYPLKSSAETVLAKIKRTGLLEVAIREDAIPFGYRDAQNNLQGLCLDFINLLREDIKQKLQLEIVSIKIYKSTLFNRFDLVENQTVDFECGPNTIRTDSNRMITFSSPFFITGTQFLVRREDRKNINLSTLEGITIGILRDTTTQELLRQKYPLATFQEFQGTTGRLRGVQALQRKRIDAFASDGILLIGEAILLGLSLENDVAIIPKNPLNCEYYGLILPQNDPEWQAFINSVVTASQSGELLRQWFADIAPYFIETLAYCQKNP
jgi:polar amino acid transport system substrate-binding protein